MKRIFVFFSVLLLIYMIWPGPSKIDDFGPLPSSAKSQLAGDTYQIPNVAGYFSDNYREFVVPFYYSIYQRKAFLPLGPIRLNHPPEYSWAVIKKHTDSTYLEQLVYPLRDSLYVNGFEPFYSDGTPKFWGSIQFNVENKSFYTKTTLRYYPSPLYIRFMVWFGIVASIYFMYTVGRRIIFK